MLCDEANMDKEMQLYYDYTVSPLGKVFYKTIWRQLEHIQGMQILDFGSGFAFTSQNLAQNNDVTAIEQDASMIHVAVSADNFKQIHGNLETLKAMESESFDMVLCHLVFEFVDNAQEILTELIRVLKKNGTMSIVRHNRAGRIVQAIVQDYDLSEAHKLLQGEPSYSSAFGHIKYYENNDILHWSENTLCIEHVYGVRALASLHNAEKQGQETWIKDMLELEWQLLKLQAFIDIAYFNHLILKKK